MFFHEFNMITIHVSSCLRRTHLTWQWYKTKYAVCVYMYIYIYIYIHTYIYIYTYMYMRPCVYMSSTQSSNTWQCSRPNLFCLFVCVRARTHIHAYVYIYIYIYIYIYGVYGVHACFYHIFTCIDFKTDTYQHSNICTYIHDFQDTYMHSLRPTYTQARFSEQYIHTHTHPYIYIYIYTYIHTYSQDRLLLTLLAP